MNTSFLNWCKVLAGNRRRVLILAQTLCLVAVAAVFLTSPFVVLAGCGGGGQKKQAVNNNVTLDGPVTSVTNKPPVPGTPVLNESVFLPGTPSNQKVIVNTHFTLKDIKPGTWVMVTEKGVQFMATAFNVSTVNGGTPVTELWAADVPPNNKGITAPLTIKNVSLQNVPKS